MGVHQERSARYRGDRPEDQRRLCGSVAAAPRRSLPPPIPLREATRFNGYEFECAAPDFPTGWSGWRIPGAYVIVEREEL